MKPYLNVFKIFGLLALAFTLVAGTCGDGGRSAASSPAVGTNTPTPTLVAAGATGAPPAITNTPPAVPPTAGSGVVTPVLGLTPHSTNTPAAPAATQTPVPTTNYPATITALAPAPTAATTATPGTTTTTGVSPDCPNLDTARAAFGVDVTLVGTETCAYTWNSGDGSFKSVKLPQNWMANTAEPDGLIYVRPGNGTSVQAKGTTYRYLPLYPGLTPEKQFELLSGYAALPQNAFASLVRCPSCAGFPLVPAAGATLSCPAVAGFTNSIITDGCLYKSSTPASFVIPAGWKAYSGSPAVWTMSGTLRGITQVSLYKQ